MNSAFVGNPDRIYIPMAVRGEPLEAFNPTARLRRLFLRRDFLLCADLHRQLFSKLTNRQNVGPKITEDLRNLLGRVQARAGTAWRTESPEADNGLFNTAVYILPKHIHGLCFSDLPVSVRLQRAMALGEIFRLGDLNGKKMSEVRSLKNIGKGTYHELNKLIARAAAHEFDDDPSNLDFRQVPAMIDRSVRQLCPHERRIFLLRMNSNRAKARSLREVADGLGVVRERVRQILVKASRHILQNGGKRLTRHLNLLEQRCRQKRFPLSETIIKTWICTRPAAAFGPAFYLRAIVTIQPSMPGWNTGMLMQRKEAHVGIHFAIFHIIRRIQKCTLARAYDELRTQPQFAEVDFAKFCDSADSAPHVRIDFKDPEKPMLLALLPPRMPTALQCALKILKESELPLTLSEIYKSAKSETAATTPRTFENELCASPDVLRFGRNVFGLERHIRVSRREWPGITRDFRSLLDREHRPISVSEVIHRKLFGWVGGLNKHELWSILRSDKSLVDLGHFLFALREWKCVVRPKIRDVILAVLRDEPPLTVAEIMRKVRKVRSADHSAVSNILRCHPLIRRLGSGEYVFVGAPSASM